MNYRFENHYTYADFISWGLDVSRILNSVGSRSQLISIALVLQFIAWLPISSLVLSLDLPASLQAPALFVALLLIGHCYNLFVHPRLSAFLERHSQDDLPTEFSSVIEVDETGIRTSDRGREIKFSWEAFHAVEDTEKNVIFIADTIHCVIPAKCFPGFLEKDAFVRDCKERIGAMTVQGKVFT